MIDEGRYFYENGAIRCIRPLLDGVPHGVHREWYPNGVLKEETPWDHGVVNGTVKYWDEKGELLGTSELKNGNGILCTWDSDGKLSGEISYLDGKWTGRFVTYLGGELNAIHYWFEGKRVPRKRYVKECSLNPRLPRYGNDSELGPTWLEKMKKAGLVKKPQQSKSHSKMSDELPLSLLAGQGVEEALSWLEESRKPPRWLGEATDQDESIDFVKRLYRLGAIKIHAVEIERDPKAGQNTSLMVIELPQDKRSRTTILRVCGKIAEKRGFDATPDVGQRYLFLKLD